MKHHYFHHFFGGLFISASNLARRARNRPIFSKQTISIFGENPIILNSTAKKRSRNFYGANVAGLGVFQTESVLSNTQVGYLPPKEERKKRKNLTCRPTQAEVLRYVGY